MKLIATAVRGVYSTVSADTRDKIRAAMPLSVKRFLGRSVMGSSGKVRQDVVTVKDGRKFYYIADRLFLRVYLDKEYEPSLTSVAERLVSTGENVIDVGANFGWYSTLFARLVGSTGKIYAYEPSDHSYSILTDNVKLNDMSDLILESKSCVGESSGTLLLNNMEGESESGLAHVVQEKSASTTEIDAVALDTDLAHLVGSVSYIKIDIEGYEMPALRGATSLFQVENQPNLQLELNDEALSRNGSSREELVSFLKGFGYEFYESMEDSTGSVRVANPRHCSDVFCAGRGHFGARLNALCVE